MKPPSQIPASQLDPQTDALLRLLTQVIFADGHVLASEIDALVRGADRLALKDKIGKTLTDANIRKWFNDYQVLRHAEPSNLWPDVTISHLIRELEDWPEKQAVIDVLIEISMADTILHVGEKSLISIVRAFWQQDGFKSSDAKIGA